MRAVGIAGSLVACICLVAGGCSKYGTRNCADSDGDGYGQGAGCEGADCDDADPAVHPGAAEVAYDGIDNDCDPSSPDDDLDGDGSLIQVDCDDRDADIHPGAAEVCGDGVDQDCDGRDRPCDCTDADGDGWCAGDGDCDDANPAVNPGADEIVGNGLDDDCDPATPDNEICANADCSAEDLPGQGRDADGDQWGECCDCDDADDRVHPQANEIIYNGKDDDCDPETSDADLDDDGHDSPAVGGDDCDDRNPNVHPGAEEFCDRIDTDCDGILDPPGCENDGGPPDGGDESPHCPDLSGTYDVLSYCLQIQDALGVEIVQTGCNIAFNLDALYCTGTVDDALNVYMECAGLGFPCTAKAGLTAPFTVLCSQQCSFIFEPVDPAGPACSFHTDPACTNVDQLCGVVGEDGVPTARCVDPNPGGRQPGYYCSESQDIYCANSLCLGGYDGYCGAICTQDAHCDPFDGTSCQTVFYDDGQGTSGNIQVCAPDNAGETRCGRSPDCKDAWVCSFRQTDDDVLTVCRSSNPGGAGPGTACMTGADCETNMCLCGDTLCDGSAQGTCSAMCEADIDCIQSQVCGTAMIPDLGGTERTVSACIQDPDACARNADCPAGKSCQLFVSPDGLSLTTECWYGAGPGTDNTGDPCANSTGCFSVWCNAEQNYCNGVCLSDQDCPAYLDAPEDCQEDSACGLQALCDGDTCLRLFECATSVFWMGFDGQGQAVYDTVNLCRPLRRACDLDDDCRSGEACQVQFDRSASGAGYVCMPGVGPGQLGDDCYETGSAGCWSGQCITEGAGGPGDAYCSQACATAEDCVDPEVWDCQAVRIDVRPGFVTYLPACIRR